VSGLVVLQPLRPAVGVDVTPAVYGFASRVRGGFLKWDGFTAEVTLGRMPRLSGVGGEVLCLDIQFMQGAGGEPDEDFQAFLDAVNDLV